MKRLETICWKYHLLILQATAMLITATWSLSVGTPPAAAMIRIDFEQKYLLHPEQEIWDFSMVRPDSTYHVFYHTLPESSPYVVNADTIWHASSNDLIHWTILGAALTVGPNDHDAEAMWAPDVFRDHESERWVMAYTGVDADLVQRPCLAYSDDLVRWTKAVDNPIFTPDSTVYDWDPDQPWSTFRDHFVYHAEGVWNLLSTASLRDPENSDQSIGVIHHAWSSDFVRWLENPVFFHNDGSNPDHVLESCQYITRGDWHHLFFFEHDVMGISHVSALETSDWTMAERSIIDWGIAPEVDRFDPGIDIFSRLAPELNPIDGNMAFSVRFDTLLFHDSEMPPSVHRPHPLDSDWVQRTGFSNNGNPTYGDNTAMRGLDSCGLVGHGWYGSAEYYQGPLSGLGTPGSCYGDGVTGTLVSRVFTITGNHMKMLVGGGYYPDTAYIALVDSASGETLFSETGMNRETMSWRDWDLSGLQGQQVYLTIIDNETDSWGHINVDEIEEYLGPTTAVGSQQPPIQVVDCGPAPNPFNPSTNLRFLLSSTAGYQIRIHDLRGRKIWESEALTGHAGENAVLWRGMDQAGNQVPAGTYLYGIYLEGRLQATSKLSLIK